MSRHNLLANIFIVVRRGYSDVGKHPTDSSPDFEAESAAEELPIPATKSVPTDLRGLLDLSGQQGESLSGAQLSDEPPGIPKRSVVESTVTAKPNDRTGELRIDAKDSTVTIPVTQLQGEPVQRGPIHEAFAEPLQLTPAPTKVLKKAPPAVVEELAPESPGEAKNMEWISGYWAWDEQRQDYIWVSGIWRKSPRVGLGYRVVGRTSTEDINGFPELG